MSDSQPRVSTRTLILTGVLVALVIAGIASYYASSHPDGLMFVAEKTGFGSTEKASPTADGPFAGYETTGIDNARVSGGVAGVVGVVVVLLSGTLLFRLLRRRRPDVPTENE